MRVRLIFGALLLALPALHLQPPPRPALTISPWAFDLPRACVSLRGGGGGTRGGDVLASSAEGSATIGRVSMPSRPRIGMAQKPGARADGRDGRRKAVQEQVLSRYRQKMVEETETRTVYVGKLPYNVSETELWGLFMRGPDEMASEPPKGAVRIARNATGGGKGFAFVTLLSVEAVCRALTLDGSTWRGRALVVQLSQRPVACDTLFVSNLPELEDEAVRRLLLGVTGSIRSLRRGEGKGQGGGWFLELQNSTAADSAFRALAGMEVQGRQLVVDYAESAKARQREPPERESGAQGDAQMSPASGCHGKGIEGEEAAERADVDDRDARREREAGVAAAQEVVDMESAGERSETDNERPTRTVLLENLNFGVSERRLLAALEVSQSQILKIDWGLDRQRMLFKGYAHVTFLSPAAAQRALGFHGRECMERPMRISRAPDPPDVLAGEDGEGKRTQEGEYKSFYVCGEKPPDCRTVFVGNLAFNITQAALRAFFSDCGPIVSVRWGEAKGEFKGFAHVDFHLSESTDLAVAKSGQELYGRLTKVDYGRELKKEKVRVQRERSRIALKPPGCRVVFVAHLPLAASEAQVGAFFSRCGRVTRVALASDKVFLRP